MFFFFVSRGHRLTPMIGQVKGEVVIPEGRTVVVKAAGEGVRPTPFSAALISHIVNRLHKKSKQFPPK